MTYQSFEVVLLFDQEIYEVVEVDIAEADIVEVGIVVVGTAVVGRDYVEDMIGEDIAEGKLVGIAEVDIVVGGMKNEGGTLE